MTSGQELALEQLQEVAAVSGGLLEIIAINENPPRVEVELSIYCGDMERKAEGLPLRDRERFFVFIPSDFPFSVPSVSTRHERFAEFPHVQWKRSLCLYQSTATEWNPSDGMFGFLERLDMWLKQGAIGQLDPIGAPLHPPVAYILNGPSYTIIPRANTPSVETQTWFGLAHLKVVSDRRVDICGWSDFQKTAPSPVGAAILLSQPMPYEFPSKLSDLVTELQSRGVQRELLFLILQRAVLQNSENDPFFFILGTPMRGVRGGEHLKQHLVVWYIDPTIVSCLRISLEKYSDHQKLQEIGEKAEKIIIDWMDMAPVEWCKLREDRPEIVVRRDQGAPVTWFAEKVVSLWGCGALGSRVAEFLARAGVKKLILRDNGIVAPGLLVRQPFCDQDIGYAKAAVVAGQIKRIRPELEVECHTRNVMIEPLESKNWTDDADLIIDTTASVAIMKKLELVRRTSKVSPVPVASMIIGHQAMNGLVVLARGEHSGGPADVYRRAKIEACNRPNLTHFADEFWPKTPRTKPFQPEPGCSESTFVGSAADVTVLAGAMLNRLAEEMAQKTSATASACFVLQPHLVAEAGASPSANFAWEADRVSHDPHAGYEIRIADSAWREIRGWIRQNQRDKGQCVETGGLLFGERDDVSQVVWITEVIGPPPDSVRSAQGFVCGIEDVDEANQEKRKRTQGSAQYIGMWHTHPGSIPVPSSTDFEGMEKLVSNTDRPASKSLLLIVNSDPESTASAIGTFVFKQSDFSQKGIGIQIRECSIQISNPAPKKHNVGLALSGGGSRAIAFHLGCLRALHDRGILEQLQVISTVSGGSIIGAMYAYSDDPFDVFDRKVVELLRRGLFKGIVRRAIFSPLLLKSLSTFAVSGSLAVISDVLRSILSAGNLFFGKQNRGTPSWIDRIQPPLRRWASRTQALEETLRQEFWGDLKLTDKRRGDVEIVINACELRTGSAFRFGSKESGCWRFERVLNNDTIEVAQAVAASAAYPVLLPAVDRNLTFVDRHGKVFSERVMLTDGGVFDNLGTSCLEPGRASDFSFNVFHPDYIIACVADEGLFSENSFPYWWGLRMTRAFESIFRKVQNSGFQRLHQFVISGELKGFILPYLGQRDNRLPYVPPDLVRREEVWGYPTNFSAMREEDITRLTRRGEQLTRLLLARYLPEL